MKIHKGLVEKIIEKRTAPLRDFIRGVDSLEIADYKPNMTELINQLDRIFYALDFLERHEFIKIQRYSNNTSIDLFNGFNFENDTQAKYTIHFYHDKLQETYSWEITMLPGLIAFYENGLKTDEQIKNSRNFWLAICVGIGSSAITAILTAILTKCN